MCESSDCSDLETVARAGSYEPKKKVLTKKKKTEENMHVHVMSESSDCSDLESAARTSSLETKNKNKKEPNKPKKAPKKVLKNKKKPENKTEDSKIEDSSLPVYIAATKSNHVCVYSPQPRIVESKSKKINYAYPVVIVIDHNKPEKSE